MTKNKLFTQLAFFSALMLIGTMAKAQVKVGKNPTSINTNAVFEMEDTTKGMLLPRLALSSSSAFTPLTAHVRGMIVYNTATALDVTPGFYYNDGVKWVRIVGSASSTGSGNLTNDNGIIVTGGIGATLINASLRLDSTAVARFLGQSPVRDSFSSLTNQLITAGGITGQNLTAGTLLQTTGTPTGASLKSAGYQVDTTALKTFISNTATSGSLTGQNLTAGTLLQTTGTPTGASLKSAGYQVDTTALKTFISNTATSGSLTGQNLTAGTLLQTTGTPTGASLKSAGYQVDTTALKTFIAGRTTNTLTNPINTITSTVNGIVATAPAVNTNVLALTSDTLTSTVNSVVSNKISLRSVKRLVVMTTAAASFTIPDTADVLIFNGTAPSNFILPAANANAGRELRILNYAKASVNTVITLNGNIITEGDVADFTDTRINSKSSTYAFPAGIGSQAMNTITIISNGTSWYKLGN